MLLLEPMYHYLATGLLLKNSTLVPVKTKNYRQKPLQEWIEHF